MPSPRWLFSACGTCQTEACHRCASLPRAGHRLGSSVRPARKNATSGQGEGSKDANPGIGTILNHGVATKWVMALFLKKALVQRVIGGN